MNYITDHSPGYKLGLLQELFGSGESRRERCCTQAHQHRLALHLCSTDRKTSRAAEQLLRSFLRPLFLCFCSCLCGSQRVCGSERHQLCSSDEDAGGKCPQRLFVLPLHLCALAISWLLFPTHVSVGCVFKCLVPGCAAVCAAGPDDCSGKYCKCTPSVCIVNPPPKIRTGPKLRTTPQIRTTWGFPPSGPEIRTGSYFGGGGGVTAQSPTRECVGGVGGGGVVGS